MAGRLLFRYFYGLSQEKREWVNLAEVRAGQLPAPGAVDFQAVPLCLQKNAKGGGPGTQLATCVAQTSVPGPPTHFPASQEEASSLHPGGPCPQSHRRCVLAGVRGEGKGKAVEGEKVLAEARRCAGPFGRRGIARLLWRCEDVEGS